MLKSLVIKVPLKIVIPPIDGVRSRADISVHSPSLLSKVIPQIFKGTPAKSMVLPRLSDLKLRFELKLAVIAGINVNEPHISMPLPPARSGVFAAPVQFIDLQFAQTSTVTTCRRPGKELPSKKTSSSLVGACK